MPEASSQTSQRRRRTPPAIPAVEEQPPTILINRGTMQTSMSTVEEQSTIVKTIVDEVVGRYSADLDEFVTNIKNLLDRIKSGAVVNISDRSLEISTIKLPVLMYFSAEGLERLGCDSDVAKAKRIEEYNNILLNSEGTIPHRQAIAESGSFYFNMVDSVYSRAYKQLKGKVETADKIFSALKKVLSKRMLELDISSRERPVNLPSDYNEREDSEISSAIAE